MNHSTPNSQRHSFVFELEDGNIKPLECSGQPELSALDFDQTSSDDSLSSGTLEEDFERVKGDVLSLFDGSGVICATSIHSSRQLVRSSRPLPLAPFPATGPPTSTWFDESPTQSTFSITDDQASTMPWDARSQQFDESPVYVTFSDRESETLSMFTFGRGAAMSPAPASESCDSHTMVPADSDVESIKHSKRHSFDSLDEQLVTSPIDSFAAMCWNSAVTSEQPDSKPHKRAMELRLSKLYGEAAREYEEDHLQEYSLHEADSLPHMQFTPDAVSRVVPAEVAPWLYLPKKAASILALPQEISRASSPTSPHTSEKLGSTSQGVFRGGHRRGQASLGILAGKCRQVMGCMSGGNCKA